MTSPLSTKKQLKQRLDNGEFLSAPGIYDGLSAKLVERAGFNVAFVSGACVSFSRLGKPDVGLVSFSELVSCVSQIRETTDLPLIVDIDTGFGNAINTQRTVKLLERVGASALQIEDQLMPKRCGHLAGKQVIPSEEMIGKLHAALDARQNEDTLIFARTDALGVEGFEQAIERAESYLQTGVDALFIEAPQSLLQMQKISAEFGHRVPLIHNLVEGGNSPVASSHELKTLNYQIALYPAALINAFIPAAEHILNHISDSGETASLHQSISDLNYINQILDVNSYV